MTILPCETVWMLGVRPQVLLIAQWNIQQGSTIARCLLFSNNANYVLGRIALARHHPTIPSELVSQSMELRSSPYRSTIGYLLSAPRTNFV